MNRQNAITVLIHDQLGQKLARVFSADGVPGDLFSIDLDGDDSLVGQLTGPGEDPPKMSIGVGLDVLDASFETLLNALPTPPGGPFEFLKSGPATNLLAGVRNALHNQLRVLDHQRDVIADLIATQDPARLRIAADTLFSGVHDLFGGLANTEPGSRSVSRLRNLLGTDVSIALPFATIFNALQTAGKNAAEIPLGVERGLVDYFFKAEGFEAVDGERVIAPVHLSDIKKVVAGAVEQRDLSALQLRGQFSKATAERYLRDIIRVIVETVYDTARGLTKPGNRYSNVVTDLKSKASPNKSADKIETQFVSWFRGFASMAESGAMRAVEVGTQGVSEFQTSPLIAAAAGTFAGTVARKLAQDSFLAVLRTEMDRQH